jgi:hypothetical protein
MALDGDSQKYLGEVRKGKPRRFAMIMKGEKIMNLVVFKKGSLDKYKKQAKESGAGQFYHGVIDGKGQNITFKLSQFDGFEEAPGKDIKLKMFLNEESGLKFHPVYEIVSALPDVTDEGDAEAPTPLPSTPPVPGMDGPEFSARLRTALPDLRAAQEVASPRQQLLRKKMAEMQQTAKAGDFGDAAAMLEQLHVMAREVLAEQSEAPAATASADGLANKLAEALNKMTPLIREAVGVAPERKPEILNPVSQIKALLAEGQVGRAREELVAYGNFLKQIKAGASEPDSGQLLSAWATAKESVDQQLELFRTALKKTGDPYLGKIADGGVESLVVGPGREFVTLQTALFELQSASGKSRETAKGKLLVAVGSYRKHVAVNQFIEVCDSNKLCGPLTVRKTLEDALAALEKSITHMAA